MKKLLLVCWPIFLSFRILTAPPLSLESWEDTKFIKWIGHYRTAIEAELNLYIEHLGYIESRNRWDVVNQIGCIGEYQFHPATLRHLGYGHITTATFQSNKDIFPKELQKKVLKTYIKICRQQLQPYNVYTMNKTIKGIKITRAGLIAGCHLGGIKSVILFLESDGRIDNKDANGTYISDYLKEFSLYNL